MATAATSACLSDSTQADFYAGTPLSLDLTSSAGDVLLAKPALLDQQNSLNGTGTDVIDTINVAAQTFVPQKSGKLARSKFAPSVPAVAAAHPD